MAGSLLFFASDRISETWYDKRHNQMQTVTVTYQERNIFVNTPEDQNILGMFFDRQEAAVAAVKQKYGRLCLSVALRILPDFRDAEECVNDTCLRAWNTIPPARPKSLQAYLCAITRNLALDRYDYNNAAKRSTALTEAFEELEPCLPASGSAERMESRQEFSDFLNGFLADLKPETRVFFVRRYWYGESIREIAEACRVTEEKVKSSLFRTRRKFADAVRKEGVSL